MYSSVGPGSVGWVTGRVLFGSEVTEGAGPSVLGSSVKVVAGRPVPPPIVYWVTALTGGSTVQFGVVIGKMVTVAPEGRLLAGV